MAYKYETFTDGHILWSRQAWASGLSPPKCRLASNVKHTGQESGGELCTIF